MFFYESIFYGDAVFMPLPTLHVSLQYLQNDQGDKISGNSSLTLFTKSRTQTVHNTRDKKVTQETTSRKSYSREITGRSCSSWIQENIKSLRHKKSKHDTPQRKRSVLLLLHSSKQVSPNKQRVGENVGTLFLKHTVHRITRRSNSRQEMFWSLLLVAWVVLMIFFYTEVFLQEFLAREFRHTEYVEGVILHLRETSAIEIRIAGRFEKPTPRRVRFSLVTLGLWHVFAVQPVVSAVQKLEVLVHLVLFLQRGVPMVLTARKYGTPPLGFVLRREVRLQRVRVFLSSFLRIVAVPVPVPRPCSGPLLKCLGIRD